MASFSSLPLELIVYISHLVEFSDLKILGSLNSRFRAILVPRIFSTLRFTNIESDGGAISHVASKHRSHISSLQFDFHLQQDHEQPAIQPLPNGRFYGADDGEMDDVGAGTKLSSVASDLLSGKILSEITTMSIKFLPEDDFEGDGWGDPQGLGCIYIYEDITPPAELEQEEKEWPSWRRAMAHMWSVLSQNHSITSLELLGLPAIPASFWQKPEWPAFLGRLETLVLGLAGGDNGAGWCAGTTPGYCDFLESLDVHIFNHTKSLYKLHLIADTECYYGESHYWSNVTSFRPWQMPNLADLRIENCFIDEKCCEFLHRKTGLSSHLKKLYMINCMANPATPSWVDLFTRLSSQPSLSLEEFVVTSEGMEFPGDYESKIPRPLFKSRDDGRAIIVRSSPKEDGPAGRPFEYGYVDDKYGMIFSDRERNAEEFERGVDMQAYRRLMRLVDGNKKESAKSA